MLLKLNQLLFRKNPRKTPPSSDCVALRYDKTNNAMVIVAPDGSESPVGESAVTNTIVNAAIAEDPAASRTAIGLDPIVSSVPGLRPSLEGCVYGNLTGTETGILNWTGGLIGAGRAYHWTTDGVLTPSLVGEWWGLGKSNSAWGFDFYIDGVFQFNEEALNVTLYPEDSDWGPNKTVTRTDPIIPDYIGQWFRGRSLAGTPYVWYQASGSDWVFVRISGSAPIGVEGVTPVVPMYADITAANAALEAGDYFWDSTLRKLRIATA